MTAALRGNGRRSPEGCGARDQKNEKSAHEQFYDAVELLVFVVLLTSVSASFSALPAAVFAFAAGFRSLIAAPRLSGWSPVIFAFSESNGISRLWETCAAA